MALSLTGSDDLRVVYWILYASLGLDELIINITKLIWIVRQR